MRSDISGMPDGGVPGKGAQHGQAPIIIHVKALKDLGSYTTEGNNITNTVT